MSYPIDAGFSEEEFEDLKNAVRNGEELESDIDHDFRFFVGRENLPEKLTVVHIRSTGSETEHGFLEFAIEAPFTKEEMEKTNVYEGFYDYGVDTPIPREGEDYYGPTEKVYPETFTRDDFLRMDYETFFNKMEKEEIPTMADYTFMDLQDAWDKHNPAIEKTLVDYKVEKMVEDVAYGLYFDNVGEKDWPENIDLYVNADKDGYSIADEYNYMEPLAPFANEDLESLVQGAKDVKEYLLEYIYREAMTDDYMQQFAKSFSYDGLFENVNQKDWPDDIQAYLADPEKSGKKMTPWKELEGIPVSDLVDYAEDTSRSLYGVMKKSQNLIEAFQWKQKQENVSAMTQTYIRDYQKHHGEKPAEGHSVNFTLFSNHGEKRDLTGISRDFFLKNGWTVITAGKEDITWGEDIIVSKNDRNTLYIDAYGQDTNKIQINGILENENIASLLREFNEQEKDLAYFSAPKTNYPIYYISDEDFRAFCNRHIDELDALLQDCMAGEQVNGELSQKATQNFVGRDVCMENRQPYGMLATLMKLEDQHIIRTKWLPPTKRHTRIENFLKQELATMKRFGLVKENQYGQFSVVKPIVQMKQKEQAVTL